MARSAEAVPEVMAILQDLREKASDVLLHFEGLRKSQSSQDAANSEGMSLLELQLQLMLDYVINVVMLVLNKVKGQSIAGSSPVYRLTELRVVLEKLRPLIHKFQYQLDKLVKTGSAALAANDPLRFRPNPASLMSKAPGQSGEDGEQSEGEGRGVYVPPRVAAMPYAEPGGGHATKSRSKHSLDDNLMEELKEEYSETPVEKSSTSLTYSNKRELDRQREQEEYEEKYFVRLGRGTQSKTGGRKGLVDYGLSQLAVFKDPMARTAKTGPEGKRKKGKKKRMLKSRRH